MAKSADVAPGFLFGVISINERETFRDKLIHEQKTCGSVLF